MGDGTWSSAIETYRRLTQRPRAGKLDVTDIPYESVRVLRSKPKRIARFRISREMVMNTQRTLQEAGRKNREGLVFWSGQLEGPEAIITRCLVPEGSGTSIGATLSERGLRDVLTILRSNGEFLFAQVHSHPRRAFHSFIDNREAISFKVGFVSIVVPHFGFTEMEELSNCKVYEYSGGGRWMPLSPNEVARRFVIQ